MIRSVELRIDGRRVLFNRSANRLDDLIAPQDIDILIFYEWDLSRIDDVCCFIRSVGSINAVMDYLKSEGLNPDFDEISGIMHLFCQ